VSGRLPGLRGRRLCHGADDQSQRRAVDGL